MQQEIKEYIKEYSILNPKEKRQLFYKRYFKQEHPEWDDSMVTLVQKIDSLNHDNLRVLDIGCGNGNFVIDELQHKILYAIGIDKTREATRKNTCLNKIDIGDAEHLPYHNNSFDLVIALWVLEHLENPMEVFKEISRVLRPNGIFAFVTPNKNSALVKIRQLLPHQLSSALVRLLYGRDENDVFQTYYRANTIKDLSEYAYKANLKSINLIENFDPSYSSFGQLSYRLTSLTYHIPSTLFKMHLIGTYTK